MDESLSSISISVIVDEDSNKNDKQPISKSNGTEPEFCEKMLILLKNFSREQFDRYEMYRRSRFSKSNIRKLVKHFTGQMINEKTAIAIAGVAKVFVGQLIEAALDYQEQEQLLGDGGDSQQITKQTPLEPKHIREACRRLEKLQQKQNLF